MQLKSSNTIQPRNVGYGSFLQPLRVKAAAIDVLEVL